jgi:hypothetical protein
MTPTAAQKRLAAERAAAARARIAAAHRRRRLITLGLSVGAVLVVVAALVVVKLVSGAGGPKSGTAAQPAAGSVTTRLATVPTSTFDAVGTGAGVTPPAAATGHLLTAAGEPRVLYIGGEFCPYCAATRWPVAVALDRFGSLHRLGQLASSPSDVYPSTATLSFHGATYTSRYVSFTGKEVQSNRVVGTSYAPLDRLDAADSKLWQDAGGGYPFVDIGGRWLIKQAPYSPQLLHGKSQTQIARALSDPSSPIARAVLGSANQISAAICRLTGGKPAAVCTSSGVTAAARSLVHAG